MAQNIWDIELMYNFRVWSVAMVFVASTVLLSACDTFEEVDSRKQDEIDTDVFADHSKRKSIFGEGGMQLFGSGGSGDEGGGNLGVNSFLWRASLDTISFMPVNSADPFGGVIITDWHAPADSPNERFKLNIYILGRTLRADGIRVAVFRQVLRASTWVDAAVPEQTKTKIEDAILTRARQIRNATLVQQNKE